MKVAMTLRNVKQKDLANALGVDRSSISQKMTRRVAWSLEDIEKASDFFHVKPEALVAGHGFEPWTSGSKVQIHGASELIQAQFSRVKIRMPMMDHEKHNQRTGPMAQKHRRVD